MSEGGVEQSITNAIKGWGRPRAVAILALVIAASSADESHQLLRFIASSVALHTGYYAKRQDQLGWAWIMFSCAALLNPFAILHLGQETWSKLFWLIAVLFYVSIKDQIAIATKSVAVLVEPPTPQAVLNPMPESPSTQNPPGEQKGTSNAAYLTSVAQQDMQAQRYPSAIDKLEQALLADAKYQLALEYLVTAYNNYGAILAETEPIHGVGKFYRALLLWPNHQTARENLILTAQRIFPPANDIKSEISYDTHIALAKRLAEEGDDLSAFAAYIEALRSRDALQQERTFFGVMQNMSNDAVSQIYLLNADGRMVKGSAQEEFVMSQE